jgi:hypothetical protein
VQPRTACGLSSDQTPAPSRPLQAGKQDEEQPLIASVLDAYKPTELADVAIVGCGPAGLYLAAQLAQRGLKVALVGAVRRAFWRSFVS